MESWATTQGIRTLIGIDEAGRGPLAGPVVAAAVALPTEHGLVGLNDSKKLTETVRERLYAHIQAVALAYGVGMVPAQTIDVAGILPCTFEAMKMAFSEALNSGLVPDLVVVDGNLPIPGLDARQKTFVGGDGRSENIAAASILAKVTRDRMMRDFDTKWPEYQFAKHKGYGTKLHLQAIVKHGACPIHRYTFRGVKAET